MGMFYEIGSWSWQWLLEETLVQKLVSSNPGTDISHFIIVNLALSGPIKQLNGQASEYYLQVVLPEYYFIEQLSNKFGYCSSCIVSIVLAFHKHNSLTLGAAASLARLHLLLLKELNTPRFLLIIHFQAQNHMVQSVYTLTRTNRLRCRHLIIDSTQFNVFCVLIERQLFFQFIVFVSEREARRSFVRSTGLSISTADGRSLDRQEKETKNQCDQMVRLCFNIWPLAAMKIGPLM